MSKSKNKEQDRRGCGSAHGLLARDQAFDLVTHGTSQTALGGLCRIQKTAFS